MEITGNTLKSAIIKKLSDSFGENYTYYKEQVLQNLKTPAFVLFQSDVSSNEVIKDIYEYNFILHLRYLPKDDNPFPLEECDKMRLEVGSCLEEIPLGNILKSPTSFTTNIIENVLHITIAYKLWLENEKPNLPVMEELNYNDNISYADINERR